MSERLYKRVKIEGQGEFKGIGPLSVQNDSSLKIRHCYIFTASITSLIFLTFWRSGVKKTPKIFSIHWKISSWCFARVLKDISWKHVYVETHI